MGNVVLLNKENFDSSIAKGNWVVDFYADWCNPCKILSPIIEEIASENKKIYFGKFDIEKDRSILQRFSILSIPTIIYFRDGEKINKTVGLLEKEEIEELINKIYD